LVIAASLVTEEEAKLGVPHVYHAQGLTRSSFIAFPSSFVVFTLTSPVNQ
jgi:hypothetical protein